MVQHFVFGETHALLDDPYAQRSRIIALARGLRFYSPRQIGLTAGDAASSSSTFNSPAT
jgi:hypothetical protein